MKLLASICLTLALVVSVTPTSSGNAQRVDAAGFLYQVNSAGDEPDALPGDGFCETAGGLCTLRAAIEEANAGAGDDGIDINLPAGTGINLTSPLPALSTNMDITGPGALKLTVRRSAGGTYRIFDVTTTGAVTLSGMTITGGASSGTGGGVQNNNAGTVNIAGCLLWFNSAGGNGGAIFNSSTGTVNVINSEFLANRAGSGAGIFNNSTGAVNVTNTTFVDNVAASNGGGIFNNGALKVTNSTIARNHAVVGGGLINNSGGAAAVKSSLVAANVASSSAPDVFGTFSSQGFNFIGKVNGSAGFTVATDLMGTVASPLDPKLDPTGAHENGGQTQTIRLLCGSPAIDKGTHVGLTGNLTTDQRGAGFPRIFDDPAVANAAGRDGTDIGAYEKEAVCNQQVAFTVNSTGDADDVNPGDRVCDTSTAIPGQQCTLRAALKEANALASDDTISLITVRFSIPTNDPGFDAATGRYTINLTALLPAITDNVTINGPGAAALTVRRNAGGDYNIFNVTGGSAVIISGLTASNGRTGFGGGISDSTAGTLNLTNCAISGNTAFFDGSTGGGILHDRGTLNITNCLIEGNSTAGNLIAEHRGGAIYNSSGTTLNITNSTISGNSSSNGGAIYAEASNVTIDRSKLINNSAVGGFSGAIAFASTASNTLSVINSTISGNNATSDIGGIGNFPVAGAAGTVNVINSTVSSNSVKVNGHLNGPGGGLVNSGGGTLNVTNSTIAGNSALSPGGIYNNGFTSILNVTNSTIARNSDRGIVNEGSARIKNSIVALNASAGVADVNGSFTSLGFNLIGKTDAGSPGFTQPTDHKGTVASPLDPKLDPAGVKNNGGLTATIALLSGSLAINAANATNAPLRDQRGYIRSGPFDIGAFEFGGTIPASLGNISTRGFVQTGDNVLIGGFIITGGGPKKIILRALGPTLGRPPFNVPGTLANPTMELRSGSGALIASNDNWESAANAVSIPTAYRPPNNFESAIFTSLNPGSYTAIVRGVSNSTGVALVEGYDLDATAGSTFGNISTRGFVQTGNNVLIGGFIVKGPDHKQVVLRALGPTLRNFNVSNALANPTLELRDANGNLITANDNWKSTQQTELSSTGLQPPNDFEAAIVRTLAPGNYTAIVRGVSSTIGVALVEAYGL